MIYVPADLGIDQLLPTEKSPAESPIKLAIRLTPVNNTPGKPSFCFEFQTNDSAAVRHLAAQFIKVAEKMEEWPANLRFIGSIKEDTPSQDPVAPAPRTDKPILGH